MVSLVCLQPDCGSDLTVRICTPDEFGAEPRTGDDEFEDAEGDGWGGDDDDLDLPVSESMLKAHYSSSSPSYCKTEFLCVDNICDLTCSKIFVILVQL